MENVDEWRDNQKDKRHGCEFGNFFLCENGTTPKELIRNKIYSAIATPLRGGEWRRTSLLLVSQALANRGVSQDDVQQPTRGNVSPSPRQLTSLRKRFGSSRAKVVPNTNEGVDEKALHFLERKAGILLLPTRASEPPPIAPLDQPARNGKTIERLRAARTARKGMARMNVWGRSVERAKQKQAWLEEQPGVKLLKAPSSSAKGAHCQSVKGGRAASGSAVTDDQDLFASGIRETTRL